MASCALAVASGHHHHSWRLYDIHVLETNVQNIERIMHSFLAVAPYRAPGQEFTHRYLLAKLSTSTEQMPSKAFRHAPSLAGYLCEDDHPATLVRESRRCEPDGTNMRILSVSSNNASLQSTSRALKSFSVRHEVLLSSPHPPRRKSACDNIRWHL